MDNMISSSGFSGVGVAAATQRIRNQKPNKPLNRVFTILFHFLFLQVNTMPTGKNINNKNRIHPVFWYQCTFSFFLEVKLFCFLPDVPFVCCSDVLAALFFVVLPFINLHPLSIDYLFPRHAKYMLSISQILPFICSIILFSFSQILLLLS